MYVGVVAAAYDGSVMSIDEAFSTAAPRLRAWLSAFERVFVLTGAGISTASGIPDYRDIDGQWKRTPPVTFQAFTGDPLTNARYWARSFVGWPRMALSGPNDAHRALAGWQSTGRLSALLTQNVDRLHARAGHQDVIDLHGRIDQVICLQCHSPSTRADLQERLREANPEWGGLDAAAAPDGDADLEGVDFAQFRVPACESCGGMLKPDVVFFGENVPRDRYENARDRLLQSDALLVVGSSLMVYSGFRFARLAYEHGRPIALLNRGRTRADDLASLKLEADCVAVLPAALD